MENTETNNPEMGKAKDDLFNFAVDREDVKWLMARLPEQADIRRAKVEYELQILKIISVGWSIAYYLESSPLKDRLVNLFWKDIHDFSHDLSEATELMTGQDINYFQVVKERLDMYVDALNKNPDTREPAQVIGPEFARTCGNGDDLFTFMTGSKMFISTVNRVGEYLEIVKLR